MKKTIYIFGNPLFEFDNLPIKLIPKLKKEFPKINFKLTDPNENLKPDNKKLIIIDTILNIDKVTVLDDLEKIETQKLYSMHDFDLGFNLKLLKKIGKLNEVLIFGVPQDIEKEEAFKQLVETIKKKIKSLF
jgi:Ni,Fe-hydrogenase maturation factor